jgi:SAM-dependent methyltransferase
VATGACAGVLYPLAAMSSTSTVWPKTVPPLTDEQRAIRDDFMKHYHETCATNFGAISWFNHTYPRRTTRPGLRTLDVGAGLGEHLDFNPAHDQAEYVALELRPEMAAVIEQKHPYVTTLIGDVEQGLPFEAHHFDRVLAIHVLEHLPNLPAALDEIKRVLRPGGALVIVIPCEGGKLYSLGRRVTTQRMFEKRYDADYETYIKTEHISVPAEIVAELDQRFEPEHRSFFPFVVPTVDLNVCLGLTYRRPAD